MTCPRCNGCIYDDPSEGLRCLNCGNRPNVVQFWSTPERLQFAEFVRCYGDEPVIVLGQK